MSYFFFRLVNRGILVTDRSIMATDDPHQVVHYTYLHIFLWEFCRKKKWFNFGICQYISLQKPNIYTVCKWNLSVRCWKQEIMINVAWDKFSSHNVFVGCRPCSYPFWESQTAAMRNTPPPSWSYLPLLWCVQQAYVSTWSHTLYRCTFITMYDVPTLICLCIYRLLISK